MPQLIMADKATVQTSDTKEVQEIKPEIKEQTIESVVTEVKESKPESVPLSKYMAEKKENKKLLDRIAELEDAKGTVTKDDLDEMAEKFDANPELLKELDKRYKNNKGEDPALTERLSKIDKLEQELQTEKLDKIFNGLWDTAMQVDPDLMNVADKDTLKKLALMPENKGLTLTQLAEKTYQNAVKGKKTIESSTSGARETDTSDIDFAKMSDDDWATVKSTPDLKKKYDDYLIQSIRF